MIVLNKLLDIFSSNSEGDLSADEAFRQSFVNVSNTFLLIYSLLVGLYSLLNDLILLAFVNMVFSLFFVSYFTFSYIFKNSKIIRWVLGVNRMAMFLYFIAIFINGNYLGTSSLVLVIYPFMALIIHGRRLGIAFSLMQTLCFIFTAFLFHNDIFPETDYLDVYQVTVVVTSQLACVFVFYVAIRWMSNIIYDRIREVYQITQVLKTKDELIDMLTKHMQSSLEDISAETNQLKQDINDAKLSEHVSIVQASVENLITTIDSVSHASEYDIKPIKYENVVFNINTLTSNVLRLYPTKRPDERHAVSISPELPQKLEGNALLTRQILLYIFDALHRKLDMSENPVQVTVSLCDLVNNGIMLNFSVSVKSKYNIDHRDLSSEESLLIEAYELDMSRRLVLAAGGEYKVALEDGRLELNFTLEYCDAATRPYVDPDLEEVRVRRLIEISTAVVPMEEAIVMIVDDNEMTQKIMAMFLTGRVKRVVCVSSGVQALDTFENQKIDIVLMDLQMPEMDGFETTRKMRQMELGSGKQVPIIAVTSYDFNENADQCVAAGMNGFIRKPFKAEDLWELMGQKLINA